MPDKKLMIENILQNNPKIKREILMQLSVEALMLIQLQTEVEILNKK
jgi:hypothetical protein